MMFFLLAQVWSVLLDLITLVGRSDRDKDIEIVLLRQQLRILQRTQSQPPCISRWEKLTLLVFVRELSAMTNSTRTRLGQVVFVFKPETLRKWHRELVRRTWTVRKGAPRGRPAIGPELEALILRLAKENPTWGYGKLHGELGALWAKLGYAIGRSTIRDVLKRQHVPPAPQRSSCGSSWRTFLSHYQDQMLACDFFTVETVWLKTLYALFCIELGSRRVHLAGCTANPPTAWVTQQARQISWKIQAGTVPARFLIHDRDTKFVAAFDTVFTSEDITIIRTSGYPLAEAPNANVCAERWIRSVREECLDKLVILSEGHLRRVLTAYIDYYNQARPGTPRVQGKDQQCSVPLERSTARDSPIERRDILGGGAPQLLPARRIALECFGCLFRTVRYAVPSSAERVARKRGITSCTNSSIPAVCGKSTRRTMRYSTPRMTSPWFALCCRVGRAVPCLHYYFRA
jgi:putative transposase